MSDVPELNQALWQSTDGAAESDADRVELLERLLGRDVCHRVGVFRLPADFVLTVVVPVYNEIRTLEQVLQRVRATKLPLEIVIVDDGSTDGVRDYLEKLDDDDVKVILHERNQGKGAALRTGFQAATGDVVVIQDADLEYDPQDYRHLLQPILEGTADVVYGSRFSGADCQVAPLWHLAANQIITYIFSLWHGRRFTDVETCYKMFRREAIQQVAPHLLEKRFGIELEMTARLLRTPGMRFYERPISYVRRSYAEGKKIGWRDGLWALWCILRY